MKIFFITIVSLFLMTNVALAGEQKQNIVNRTFSQAVEVQKKLNFQITKTLKKIKKENNPKTYAIGIFFAFLYGIIHAIGPGHSKGIVASYFTSNEEKLKKVPIMAFQISMTHVITPILLVMIADISLSQVFSDPDSQLYWFKFASYLLITGIGIFLLISRFLNGNKDTCRCNHNSTALAISAGLVPCIGSLLILLFTAANKMFLTGVMLVIAVGLGIGITITIVGLLSFYFRKLFVLSKTNSFTQPVLKTLNYAGPVLITALGIVMFAGLI